MKVHKINYYKYNHEYIKHSFDGEPEFVNEFTIRNEYWPTAVYYLSKPNKLKGQKDFLLFGHHPKKPIRIREMSMKQIEAERYQYAILCRTCSQVIYSIMRHDLHTCGCGSYYIDGGKEAFLFGKNIDTAGEAEIVVLDLLTDQIMPEDFKGPVKPKSTQEETQTTSGIIIPTMEEIKKLGLAIEDLETEIIYPEDL